MKNLSNKKTKKKGFTLIELIIVLAVMAIIAAIAIPSFSAVRSSSRTKADQQSCETIKRNVLTLVADETVTGASTVTLTFDATTKAFADATPNPALTTGLAELKAALKEVKKPQTGAAGYTIVIDANGGVVVSVTGSTSIITH